jgi:hypothetical protein
LLPKAGGNNLCKEGIDFLVEAKIPGLKTLNIWGNQLGSEGVKSLIYGSWPELENLNLCTF